MGPWVVLAMLLAAAIGSQVAFESPLARPNVDRPVTWLRTPEVTRRVSLGFAALAADIYWLRAVQYYGDTKLSADRRKQYDQLYPLLDTTTTLDPRFNIAYRFGALLLSEAYPNGPGNPDQAIALLKKGMRAMPGRWQYYHDAGFVEYWWRHDYAAASDWFVQASKLPNAPIWLRTIAASMMAEGGNAAASRALWSEIAATAEQEWLRASAKRALMQLDTEAAIGQLQGSVKQFRDATGRSPASWSEMVSARLLPGIPVDPTGTPFRLDPMSGAVDVSNASTLYPLPRRGAAQRP